MPSLLHSVFHWLLPYTCVLCSAPGHNKRDLCADCYQELPWLAQMCPQCAQPYSSHHSNEPLLCGACLKNPPPYDNTVAIFSYQKPVDYLVSGLKFHSRLVHARLLSQLLFERLEQHYLHLPRPQIIIPVPLHTARLRERGFNQAVELARLIAKTWRTPISLHDCQRVRSTSPQTSLPAGQRRKNLKNAFEVREDFCFDHVALLDDVITTGSTVRELSRQLRRQGIKKIDVWCCARTSEVH